jgi:alpha-beta hydrolase superfamily lysophospholipase
MNLSISPPRDVTIRSADGTELRGWLWTRRAPRGVLVIAHGFGEHGGCYRHVAEVLGPALEVDVLSFDQRGHGRSPGRRGVVRHFDHLIADVRAGVAWASERYPALPRFLLGHSNGGLLSLILLVRQPHDPDAGPLSGLIVSNPAIQIVTPISRPKLLVGRLLLHGAPWVTLGGKLDPTLLTRDPASQREHTTDPLRHSRISPPLFFGMEAAGRAVAEGAAAVTLPVLMLLGGADPVIDAVTSQRVFERLGSPDRTLKLYPEMLHEPLNEVGRERVLADIEEWLGARIEGSGPGDRAGLRPE